MILAGNADFMSDFHALAESKLHEVTKASFTNHMVHDARIKLTREFEPLVPVPPLGIKYSVSCNGGYDNSPFSMHIHVQHSEFFSLNASLTVFEDMSSISLKQNISYNKNVDVERFVDLTIVFSSYLKILLNELNDKSAVLAEQFFKIQRLYKAMPSLMVQINDIELNSLYQDIVVKAFQSKNMILNEDNAPDTPSFMYYSFSYSILANGLKIYYHPKWISKSKIKPSFYDKRKHNSILLPNSISEEHDNRPFTEEITFDVEPLFPELEKIEERINSELAKLL